MKNEREKKKQVDTGGRRKRSEIISDIRRGDNLYKRPRFQTERVIAAVTSNGIIGSGEVAPPAHCASDSILRALAVTYRPCSGSERRPTWGRSAQPDAIAPRPLQPKLCPKALAGIGRAHRCPPSVLHPGLDPQNEGINATRNWRKAVGSNKLESGQ